MNLIAFSVEPTEISELGLLMSRKYGSNLAKMYIILRCTAECSYLMAREGVSEDERETIDKTRKELDIEAVKLAEILIEHMEKSEGRW